LTQVKTGAAPADANSAIIKAMQTLRHAHRLARFVLAWFVLSLGVAIASPLVKPQAMELVCSTAGAVKLVKTGDDGADTAAHLLDCPLCLTSSAPPPALHLSLPQAQVQAPIPQSTPATHIAGRAAAALPPRGPPFLA
jgi:hypothetical protein